MNQRNSASLFEKDSVISTRVIIQKKGVPSRPSSSEDFFFPSPSLDSRYAIYPSSPSSSLEIAFGSGMDLFCGLDANALSSKDRFNDFSECVGCLAFCSALTSILAFFALEDSECAPSAFRLRLLFKLLCSFEK